MKSSNPSLNEGTFADAARSVAMGRSAELMTIDGAVNRSLTLLALLVASAVFVWMQAFATGLNNVPAIVQNPGMLSGWMVVGGLGGFALALATIFKPVWAPWSAPAYALCEGLLIGAVSARYEAMMSGIVMQAALLTIGTLATMLMGYKAGVIRATEKFRSGLIAATGGIALVYLASFIFGMFGVPFTFMMDSSPLSIGISLVVIVVAALNLILDFDMIEQGVRHRAPKYMEWYAGFSLLVTLVWLYMEFLRLLSKVNNRD
ncbi:MAG: Bax inhibitor-1/YccA family protein [Zetaproteobacteria bacterium]|nr:Bax inhibitor-1/YccA family protein [Zetaproteobacteria bacterium]